MNSKDLGKMIVPKPSTKKRQLRPNQSASTAYHSIKPIYSDRRGNIQSVRQSTISGSIITTENPNPAGN
jgi:hypothetical protein